MEKKIYKDYYYINENTKFDYYLIPIIKKLFNVHEKERIFSTLDLKSRSN